MPLSDQTAGRSLRIAAVSVRIIGRSDSLYAIRAELGRFKYEVQAYRPATTVLRLLNRHSSVAERTSEIAIESNIFTVKGFRSILSAQERKHVEETAPEPDLNSLFCSHDGEVSG